LLEADRWGPSLKGIRDYFKQNLIFMKLKLAGKPITSGNTATLKLRCSTLKFMTVICEAE
jgi:hypothetical protein